MASSADSRFASVDEDKLQEMIDNVEAVNTKRSTNTSVKILREYLATKDEPADFESFSIDKLDTILANFFVEIRNKEGGMYKKSSLVSYRHGLQRYLEKLKDVNILKDAEFRKSQKAFKAMTKMMKKEGLAKVHHYTPITAEHLEHIYSFLSTDLDNSQLLQYKVFMDIMLHFGRRGRQGLSSLARDDFAIAVTSNEEGGMYVYYTRNEKNPNQQEDVSSDQSEPRMYEKKDSNLCPVKSFVKYTLRLNPKCKSLFQQPRPYPKDGVYYNSVPLGHNKLGQFMSEICRKTGLSTIYTNHSCRKTTANDLDTALKYSVLSVTGPNAEPYLIEYHRKSNETISENVCDKIRDKVLNKDNDWVNSFPLALSSVDTTHCNNTLTLAPLKTISHTETLISNLAENGCNSIEVVQSDGSENDSNLVDGFDSDVTWNEEMNEDDGDSDDQMMHIVEQNIPLHMEVSSETENHEIKTEKDDSSHASEENTSPSKRKAKKINNECLLKKDEEIKMYKTERFYLLQQVASLRQKLTSYEKEMNQLKNVISYEKLQNDSKHFKYYTGFTHQEFQSLYGYLKPDLEDEKEKRKNSYCDGMSLETQLVLTLNKLKNNFSFTHLAHLHSVKPSLAKRIFMFWLQLISEKSNMQYMWPHRETIKAQIPADFKKDFPTSIAVLKRVKITGHSSLNRHSLTVCKRHAVLAVEPQGQVVWCSNLVNGNPSNKELFESCGLQKKLATLLSHDWLSKGDGLVADESFNIRNELHKLGLKYNDVSYSKNDIDDALKKILCRERVQTHKVLVDSAFRRVRNFKILTQKIPSSLYLSSEKMLQVCSFLTNFQSASL